MEAVYQAQQWVNQILGETWGWFSTLTKHEWMVILGICSAFGFLCMRGIVNRGKI